MRHLRTLLLILAVALLASCLEPEDSPELEPNETAEPAGAAPLTGEDLVSQDAYWPEKVYVTGDWTPDDSWKDARKPIRGMLLRVPDPGHVRVDFGRLGIHEVPIAETDVLPKANALRVEAAPNRRGNLTRLLSGALTDTRFEQVQPYRRHRIVRSDILLVAAPLDAELLRGMAESLREFHVPGEGMNVVLLVQKKERDSVAIFETLREIGWEMPFLRWGFVESATNGYLEEGHTIPWIGLMSPFGRSFYQAAWREGMDLSGLRAAAEARREHRLAVSPFTKNPEALDLPVIPAPPSPAAEASADR